jgi:Uma2 family endonuclease
VDERLLAPEVPFELVGGVVSEVAPSKEAHGSAHFELSFLLGAHLAPGFKGAVDMLTRADRHSDFAPDAAVFEIARNPRTGGRKLEELAFEVCDAMPPSTLEDKVRRLVRRGVRRVFAIDLPRGRVLEWRGGPGGGWGEIAAHEAIVDERCLVVPLPVCALLDAAQVDNAASVALLAKKTAPLVEALAASRQEGVRDGELMGLRRGVEEVCSVLGLKVSASRAAYLAGLDAAGLNNLLRHLLTTRSWPR